MELIRRNYIINSEGKNVPFGASYSTKNYKHSNRTKQLACKQEVKSQEDELNMSQISSRRIYKDQLSRFKIIRKGSETFTPSIYESHSLHNKKTDKETLRKLEMIVSRGCISVREEKSKFMEQGGFSTRGSSNGNNYSQYADDSLLETPYNRSIVVNKSNINAASKGRPYNLMIDNLDRSLDKSMSFSRNMHIERLNTSEIDYDERSENKRLVKLVSKTKLRQIMIRKDMEVKKYFVEKNMKKEVKKVTILRDRKEKNGLFEILRNT